MKLNAWKLCLTALFVTSISAGCEDKPSVALAPTASSLAPAKPATAESKKFSIQKDTSKIDFMMEAPQEKIRGRVEKAAEGDLQVDLGDITKTVGVINVDISGIEVYQTKANDKGEFGKEEKSDLQNEHVRNWLEIGKDAPDDAKKANSKAAFSIKKIEAMGDTNLMKMTGADRKVPLKASGEFLLHGRKAEKTAELEATFHFEGDKVASVTIKTTKPLTIGLEEYDVKPREAFGKLAAKTLSVLAPKVAKEALVSIELTAKAN